MAGKIYLTGDLHGDNDRDKLSSDNFPDGCDLDENDYVIVLGDFGVIWKAVADNIERKLIDWFDNKKPWTTLFVDGNHEMHPRLYDLPKKKKFGGIVGKVSDSIYHLKRGEVYTIHGKKFFTFGGAVSIDKLYRTEGLSWWPEEVPSNKECEYGLKQLDKHGNKVDYILSHTCPSSLVDKLSTLYVGDKFNDPTCEYLQTVVEQTEFEKLYFGHFHQNRKYGKYNCLYGNIERLL